MEEKFICRKLALSLREENVREQKQANVVVQFPRKEIFKHFKDSMDEIKSQYSVADMLLKAGDKSGCEIIWRSQIVLAEGLLDFYIHEMSKYCMLKMFNEDWEKTEKYLNFKVTMAELDKAVSKNNNDWFFEYLNERFGRDVFLAADNMRDQLNLIGIEFVNVMCRVFPRNSQNESCEIGKTAITELFCRRNKIAHQFDRNHTDAEQEIISKEYVRDYIGKVESIVNAINEIAKQRDKSKKSETRV